MESMSVAEACQLLKSGNEHSIQLEIIPARHLENCNNRDILTRNCKISLLFCAADNIVIAKLVPSDCGQMTTQHLLQGCHAFEELSTLAIQSKLYGSVGNLR